jgi:hypothetical protein
MPDHALLCREESTTHGERLTCVVELSSARRQRLSCDLSQLMTLRDSARSEHDGAFTESSKADARCNLCARSVLSPMFPAARASWPGSIIMSWAHIDFGGCIFPPPARHAWQTSVRSGEGPASRRPRRSTSLIEQKRTTGNDKGGKLQRVYLPVDGSHANVKLPAAYPSVRSLLPRHPTPGRDLFPWERPRQSSGGFQVLANDSGMTSCNP